ncbi:MAG TPA: hypothetical protein VN317_11070 [Candidatus Methanoperedens sp.]|nr:hypothetical protein [Candidatus Methanoperedens sp.]
MSARRKAGAAGAPRTTSLRRRASKVRHADLARPVPAGASFATWLGALPGILAANDLRALAAAIAAARRRQREVLLGIGAHVIKCGLSPWIVALMQEGLITGVAMNGAGAVHDFELAFAGATSEDVGPALEDGTFGMAQETADFLNNAAADAALGGLGFGEALGEAIAGEKLPHAPLSICAAGARLGTPVTVHVAIGTDIVHMHPSASGAAIGEASLRDFHRFAERVRRLERGVYLNAGSAVILPEVFLKALALARSRTKGLPRRFTTANLDFIPAYRPLTNVVRRPTTRGGTGYQIIGHHELLLPLLFTAVREELVGRKKR